MELRVPQALDEADVRCVEVEEPDRRSCRAETVLYIRRDRNERAGPGVVPRVVQEELDLAFEHVERVGVVGVGVRLDAFEFGREGKLERLDLWQLGEHAVLPDPLSLAWACEERLVHRSGSCLTT